MQRTLTDTTSRLVDLLNRIRTETDPARYDELATEISRMLEVRENASSKEGSKEGSE